MEAKLNNQSTITCYCYDRVSDQKQVKFGYSMESQKKTCAEYARSLGYRVLEIFEDKGESGTSAEDRPEFQRMLNLCEDQPVGAVVVYNTDRFARNEYDHFLVKGQLDRLGIRLLSVAQPMLDESPEGHLLDTVLAGVNAFYSRDLSRKTKKGMNEKWEQGWYPSWASVGYKNVKGSDGKGIIEVDEATGPIIKKALSEIFPTGNYSIYSLQKWFFDQGIKSATGKVIQFSGVHKILTNTFYYGWMKWGGKEKWGNHKPLITKEIYDMNQYILAKHRQFLIRERKYDFLLRSFVFCQRHNRRLVAEYHKINSKAHPVISYYHCGVHGGCKGSYVDQDELEQAVANQFKKYEFSQDFIDLVAKKCREKFDQMKEGVEGEKKGIINQRTRWEEKREKLENMLLDGTVDRETYKRKHAEIQIEINALNAKLAETERKRDFDVNLIDEVLALTRNIYEAYMSAPKFLKRHYLRFFFEKMVVAERKIVEVVPTPVFLTLQSEAKVIFRGNWLPG